MDETAHTGFRDRRIQPLCHLSGGAINTLDDVVGSSPPQRREAKKARKRSAQSPASSPDSTWGRWLSRGSASTFSTDPAAPALGSVVPNTTRGTRARTIAPAHIAQGS